MKRRLFLAATAGLGMLPGVGDDIDSPVTEVRRDDYGSEHTAVESGDPVFGAVHVHDMVESEADINVHGYSYDDESSQVECDISVDGAGITLGFDPDRARELAAELVTAADAAENGKGQ